MKGVEVTRIEGPYGNNHETPKGNSYVFFLNKPLKIIDEDDIKYFKELGKPFRVGKEKKAPGKKEEKTRGKRKGRK